MGPSAAGHNTLPGIGVPVTFRIPSAFNPVPEPMRPRDQILGNLDSIYQTSYSAAKAEGQSRRMAELDAAYQRDQLMMEVFLDVRDLLLSRESPSGAGVALDHLEALRRLAKLR